MRGATVFLCHVRFHLAHSLVKFIIKKFVKKFNNQNQNADRRHNRIKQQLNTFRIRHLLHPLSFGVLQAAVVLYHKCCVHIITYFALYSLKFFASSILNLSSILLSMHFSTIFTMSNARTKIITNNKQICSVSNIKCILSATFFS